MTDIKIAILLSTYNSDRYLKEQLDSVISQTEKGWVLYIRDDGSKDGTLPIIERYCRENCNILFLKDTLNNLGAKNSFIKLLTDVEASYYMFCDHDDIWFSDKIEKTFQKMREAERNHPQKPVLIFTDLTVVDTDLKAISSSMWKYQKTNPHDSKDFYALSIANPVTGCTIMINKMAKTVSLPMSPDSLMHDLWIALNVSHFGHIDFIEEPTMLYRQHSNNVVGAKNANRLYFLSRLKNISKVLKDNLLMIRMMNSLRFNVNSINYIFMKFKMLITRLYR